MLLFLFACIGGKFSGVYTVDRSDSDEVAQVRSTSVTSNSLEPGIVATNLSSGITDNPTFRNKIKQKLKIKY